MGLGERKDLFVEHFEPVEFFGGQEAFVQTRRRDRRKARLAKRHGVKLFTVTDNYEIEDLVQQIDEHKKEQDR